MAIATGLAASLGAVAPAIAQNAPHANDRVLVRFVPGAASDKRSAARAAAAADLQTSYKIVPGLELLKVHKGRTVEQAIEKLRRNPNVLYAEPDYLVRPALKPSDPYFVNQWAMANIQAARAWEVTTGSNVAVAIIDSGIDMTHPDLEQNIWTNPGEVAGNGIDDDRNGYVDDVHGWDFVGNDNDPSDSESPGHGTPVAGVVGARGNNGVGVAGINWRIKLVPLRFINEYGFGTTSGAISAFQYARTKGIRISNNSWGSSLNSQSMYDAIKSLQAIGHLAVCAAGNESSNTDFVPSYPASFNLDNVISVAAINSNETLVGYSNYGSKSVDLGAPGYSVVTTTSGGATAYLEGTSIATPHVTGAAAMLLGLNPAWSYGQIRSAILNTARPIAALSGKTVTGGTLDLNAAVRSAVVLPTYTVSPTSLDYGEQPVGSPSDARIVTLTNTGTLAVRIASIGVTTNQFGVTHDCPESVSAGATCAISVVFKPTSGGAKTATLDITGAGGADVASVALSGSGLRPVFTLAPGMLDFGALPAGETSTPQTITLTNTGTVALPIQWVSQPHQFAVTHNCGASVAPGAGCAIDVVFKPTLGGGSTSTLYVQGGNDAASQSVSLKGTGVAPKYTRAPSALDFGEVALGVVSPAQTVSLTNTGTVPLQIASIHLVRTQQYAADQFGLTHNCVSVTPGASCPIGVVFKPTAGGTQKATLTIEVRYGDTRIVPLTGTAPMQVENPPGPLLVPATDTDGSYRIRWGASATEGVTYVLQESWDSTFAIAVGHVYSGPTLSAAVSNRSNGGMYFYRVKAKTAISESAWVYGTNGCLVTFPIVVRLQLLTLPDVNSSGVADLAVLRVDTRTLEIREGQDGALIRSMTFLDDGFSLVGARPLPDLNGNGVPELALLAMRDSDLRGMVEIRDLDGSAGGSQVWLPTEYPPIAISTIEDDADDDGVPEFAALMSRESDGRAVVQVQNAGGVPNVRTLLGPPGYTPLDLETLPDADNDGVPDLAVLATRASDRRILVQVRNANGAGAARSTWFAQGQTAIDLGTVADKDADGIPEVAVLSVRNSAEDGQTLLEVKNAAGPMPNARALWTRPGYWAGGVKGLRALPGTSVPRVAILLVRDYDYRPLVSLRDAFGTETPQSLLYPSSYFAHDLAILPDIDQNGIEEVAVVMEANGRVLVQIRNTSGDPAPRNYWFDVQ
jgi:hypothetical protein